MFDRGLVPVDEFAKKLINQGMILGTSAFVRRVSASFFSMSFNKEAKSLKRIPEGLVALVSENEYQKYKEGKVSKLDTFLSKLKDLKVEYNEKVGEGEVDFQLNEQSIHTDVSFVNASDELDIEAFKNWREEFKAAKFISEDDGTFKVSREVEKMSKSKYNVVNPDNICAEYGADSLRLFEMFLGPLEQAKPWKTSGISGVHSFLKKLWKLFYNGEELSISDSAPTAKELKTLHKTIKKVEEDIENFSFNTSVSTFMIAVNELIAQKCNKRAILEPLLILISPYAPHIAEELWEKLGNTESISTASFPIFEPQHLVESSKNYPVSFNGKMRFTMELPLDMTKDDIEKEVLAHQKTQAQLAGRVPKKIIIVPGKIINIVG
jgi:leucyl-tRNA synthetase